MATVAPPAPTAPAFPKADVIKALCAIETVIGIELRDNIVQTGGYASVEEALGHLVPRIEKVWVKKKGSKP